MFLELSEETYILTNETSKAVTDKYDGPLALADVSIASQIVLRDQ